MKKNVKNVLKLSKKLENVWKKWYVNFQYFFAFFRFPFSGILSIIFEKKGSIFLLFKKIRRGRLRIESA